MKTLFVYFLIFILVLFVATSISAQVAINNDGSAPDNSAMLDVKSTNKGVLVPRLTQQQIQNMSNHSNGLLVYCIDDSKFYSYHQISDTWKELLYGPTNINSAWSLNDSVALGWQLDSYNKIVANETYLFLLSRNRDSMYIYNSNTLEFVKKQFFVNRAQYEIHVALKNNRLFVKISDTPAVIGIYDVSDINNITLLQTIPLDQGFFYDQPEDLNYLFYVAHWNQKVQIIDITSNPVMLNQYVSVNGNSSHTSRFGNYLYVSNNYSQCVRVDITNPNSCIVIPFGNTYSSVTGVTNSGFLVQSYNINVTPISNCNVNIYNGSTGELLATKTNFSLVLVLPNNYCILKDNSDNIIKLYDIHDGTFVFVKNFTVESINDYTYNYSSLYFLLNNKIYRYNRGL